MENAEEYTEINGEERRDTLPRVYGLRSTQLYGQLKSTVMDLQTNTWNLRQNVLHAELYSFPFSGNLWEALTREDLEGEEREIHGT